MFDGHLIFSNTQNSIYVKIDPDCRSYTYTTFFTEINHGTGWRDVASCITD